MKPGSNFFCSGKTAARIFVEVSNRCSNDSFLDFIFERFDLLLTIMGRFLKKEVLEKTDTFKKLLTIDPADKKNQKHLKHVDIGFAA